MSRFPRLRFSLRTLVIGVLLVGASFAFAAEPDAKLQYPLWDGSETIEHYARCVNLPSTKTLDLGSGVKLELVLIPAGEFIMGTPKPQRVDEESFRNRILEGQIVAATSGALLLILLAALAVRAVRRRRAQYSLAWFIVVILVAGVGVWGGVSWWNAPRALEQAKAAYRAGAVRYNRADDSEKPAHRVTITTPFYLGKCEVTQSQYEQILLENPSYFKDPDRPVHNVDLKNAQQFCEKVSHFTSQMVRLPTEAEWEFACRSGGTTDVDEDLDRVAWYSDNSDERIHRVGTKAANAWGLFDMLGNVDEYCRDHYGHYQFEPQVDPVGNPKGSRPVARGGDYNSDLDSCRPTHRANFNRMRGFRVAVGICPFPGQNTTTRPSNKPSVLFAENELDGLSIKRNGSSEWVTGEDEEAEPGTSPGATQEIEWKGLSIAAYYCQCEDAEEARRGTDLARNVAIIFNEGLWVGAQPNTIGDECWCAEDWWSTTILARRGKTCFSIGCHGNEDAAKRRAVVLQLARKIAEKIDAGGTVVIPEEADDGD